MGSDGAARDAALAGGGVAGVKTGAGASPDGTGEAEGCDVDGAGAGGRAALSLKPGDDGAAWPTCAAASAAAPSAIAAGVETDGAAWGAPPAPGRVGLEVKLEGGGALGGAAAAVAGAIVAASCAWIADDRPGSAAVRRGPVGFASAGAPSVASEEAEPSGAEVVCAVDEVERAWTGEVRAAAGAVSAAEAAWTGAFERGAAVRAARGLGEASSGEADGGAAVVDSSEAAVGAAVGAAGPRSATERSEDGGDGGGIGDADGDDVDWEGAGAVVVGS
jgi:hypothetical protein